VTRAVFFDVDFTLIRPGPMFEGEGYRRFCQRHGVAGCDPAAFPAAVRSASALLHDPGDQAYDPAFFLRYIRQVIVAMGGRGPGIDACAEAIYREWADCRHFGLYPDVRPALAALHAAGLKLGLISNTHRSMTALARHFGLEALISAAVSSADHGFNKPHSSIFEAALRLVGAAPADAVMVGDSYAHDVEGARAAGMGAILLQRDGMSPGGAAPGPAPGTPIIRSLMELPDLLLPAGPGQGDARAGGQAWSSEG
jgi:putative hydrolase of the HAD superfamily